ncbi:MAG: hypothetical protein IT212_11680 [Bacteroidia bacterium]|nr:hypothetical protein [Bacteroidia bacterium]
MKTALEILKTSKSTINTMARNKTLSKFISPILGCKFYVRKGNKSENITELLPNEAILFVQKYNKIANRTCLTCNKTFKSMGSHNRRCPTCTIRLTNDNLSLVQTKAYFKYPFTY